MFMKSGKKKAHPLMAIGIGAMALYGAYSMVQCIKEGCMQKCKMMSGMFKKKNGKEEPCGECACGDECDC